MSTRVQILGPSPQRAAIAAQQREQQLANFVDGITTECELLRAEVIALRSGMPPADVPQTPAYNPATAPAARVAPPQAALASIPSPTGAMTPTVNAAAPIPGAPTVPRPKPPLRQNLIAGAGAPGGGETYTSKDGSKVQLLGRVANVRAAGAPGAAPPAAGPMGAPARPTPRFLPPILQQAGAPIGQEIVNADGSKVLLLATPLATRPRPNQIAAPPAMIVEATEAPPAPAIPPAPAKQPPALEMDRFDLIEID